MRAHWLIFVLCLFFFVLIVSYTYMTGNWVAALVVGIVVATIAVGVLRGSRKKRPKGGKPHHYPDRVFTTSEGETYLLVTRQPVTHCE